MRSCEWSVVVPGSHPPDGASNHARTLLACRKHDPSRELLGRRGPGAHPGSGREPRHGRGAATPPTSSSTSDAGSSSSAGSDSGNAPMDAASASDSATAAMDTGTGADAGDAAPAQTDGASTGDAATDAGGDAAAAAAIATLAAPCTSALGQSVHGPQRGRQAGVPRRQVGAQPARATPTRAARPSADQVRACACRSRPAAW